ncbi:MAG: hypothetical protein R3178_08750 [Rhodothermales bacterium]|nr:hypothetical protein [Rhodothermales bacterium]
MRLSRLETASACTLVVLLYAGCYGESAPSVTLEDVPPATTAQLIGVSAAGSVVWVSGTSGTFGRSLDDGLTWHFGTVAGADSLQFRDVHAIDSSRAFLLSIGPADQSRIYYTSDGGESWSRQWTNNEPDGFFDCFDFWDPLYGLAMGDAVRGRITMVRTVDGASWSPVDTLAIPPGGDEEGGFAASGTCLVVEEDSLAWVATGSPEASRVYRTADRGQSWQVVEVPIVSDLEASGPMSLAFVSAERGFAAGGALSRPDDHHPNFAATVDRGATWELRGRPQLPNVYGIAATPQAGGVVILAVGPKGLDVTLDGGYTWQSVDKRNYWGVHFLNETLALAVGPRGRIVRISIEG